MAQLRRYTRGSNPSVVYPYSAEKMTGFFATETEAAALKATLASYHDDDEHEWPMCEGVCQKGVCALSWDTPSCCKVPAREWRHDSREAYGREAYVTGDDVATTQNGESYGHGRLYCWK